MRKLLCKLFNKHNYEKTGANQHGYYGYCKYCGKRFYKAIIIRGLIGKPINPNLSGKEFTISSLKKLPKNFGKIK